MFTTIIHPLRKAYNLSVAEYCILEAIRNLQTLEKYDYWCVASQQQIADAIGVSREWVLSSIKSLEIKGLVKRRKKNSKDTAVRVDDEWAWWFDITNQKYILFLKSESCEILTGDYKGLKDQLVKKVNKLNLTCEQSSHELVNKVHIKCEESSHNTNNNTNIDIDNNISKDILEAKPQEFGNTEINNTLKFLKQTFGLSDFKESQKIQRQLGKHLINLVKKVGKDKFREALTNIGNDSFKSKNCNSLKYLYGELKAFPYDKPLLKPQTKSRLAVL